MIEFSSIDSLSAILYFVGENQLMKVLLLPTELGGQDVPENVVYIPPHLKEAKDNATAELIDAVRAGMTEVAIIPEYRGASFIPNKLLITAARPGEPPGYDLEMGIW